jgi:hypothetical protein
LLCTALLCSLARAAGPALPQRDLTVELRQVEQGREDGGSHYSAGSADESEWEPQELQVRNGEKAVLRMNDAIPMQWTQSASAPNPAAVGNAANAGGSVTNALAWFDAGQSVSVQPRWAGGNKPAVVEIEVQRAAVEQRMGADLPKQTRNTVSTTVTLPLAEWVTIAATGALPKAGVYSSEAGLRVRRLLQIRVMAP